jgi:predicted DNA-binding transcriptional regulator AlpA
MNQGKLLGEKDAAKFLGLSVYTLRNWRHQLRPPNYIKLGGRTVRYRLEDLEQFIADSRIERGER